MLALCGKTEVIKNQYSMVSGIKKCDSQIKVLPKKHLADDEYM